MDQLALDIAGHCACDYPFCARPPPTWRRQSAAQEAGGEDDAASSTAAAASAEAKAKQEEIAALREVVATQQQTIEELCAELEAEQDAASAAASATMSTILRLQHEKAEIQTEARQYKRFMEEKMAYDELELDSLECFVHCLSSEVRSYRNRLLRHGIDPGAGDGDDVVDADDNVDGDDQEQYCECEVDLPVVFDYPQIKCALTADDNDDADDEEEAAYLDTPHGQRRIYRTRTMEKGQTATGHCRRCSRSFSNPWAASSEKGEEDAVTAERKYSAVNVSDDEASERVVHEVPMTDTSDTSAAAYYVETPKHKRYYVEVPKDDQYYVETPLTDDEKGSEAAAAGEEEEDRTGGGEAAGLKQLCVLTYVLVNHVLPNFYDLIN